MDTQGLNPYIVCWLRSMKLEPGDIGWWDGEIHPDPVTRSSHMVRDPKDNKLRPWSLVFKFWIRGKWGEWAASLGFFPIGSTPAHHLAMDGRHGALGKPGKPGHTREEFSAWLEANTSGDQPGTVTGV